MTTLKKLLLLSCLINLTPAWAQVSYEETHSIFQSFYDEYSTELQSQNSVLVINPAPSPDQPDFWWNLDYTHASYSTVTTDQGIRQHQLFIFGGFARMPGMTADSLIKTICHEVGHGIGGAPFKKKQQKEMISTEGQSDYFATSSCLRRMFHRRPQIVPPSSRHIEQLCGSHLNTEKELNYCYRAFAALEVDIQMFRDYYNTETSFERKDPLVVTEINHDETFYPSPQCRLDTSVAGVLNLERPRCWWTP